MSVPLEHRLRLRDYPDGRSPVMYQRWSDLLFLHWRVDPEILEATLPAGLKLDLDENGDAWLGIVPFAMSQIRPRGLFAVPWISDFLELNVRTYVLDENGQPGVYFYSLDAERLLAVIVARIAFHLPYYHASMEQTVVADGWTSYSCWRSGRDHEDEAAPHFRYRPDRDAVTEAKPGSVEFFLLERYLLFTPDGKGGIRAGRVNHAPYRYTTAIQLEKWSTTSITQAGFDAPETPPDHVSWAAPVDVSIFALE